MATKNSKLDQIKDLMDDLIFNGWNDAQAEELEAFLKALKPRGTMVWDTIRSEFGTISNDFGEECEGNWNAAGERAGKAIGKLLRKMVKNFRLGE